LAATGILAALHRRQTTGEGDHVQTSLLEAGVMFTFLQSAIALASGTIPTPLGSAHPLYAPYEVFQASGGWIALGTANEANWLRLVEVIGRPELARDPQFSTTSARVENRKELKTALSQCFAGAPRDTWVERLAEVGVPCGPVLTVPQMLEHSQVQSCGMVVSVHHREFGDSRAIGCPLKFSRTGTALPKPAPLLNEN
jgi:crotonobetainyl-CoA:carnitine CoA-transferase CaiB-like acyl-CoA transferase